MGRYGRSWGAADPSCSLLRRGLAPLGLLAPALRGQCALPRFDLIGIPDALVRADVMAGRKLFTLDHSHQRISSDWHQLQHAIKREHWTRPGFFFIAIHCIFPPDYRPRVTFIAS